MNRKTSYRLAGYFLWFLLLTLFFALVNFPREYLTSWTNTQLSRATDGAIRVEEASLKFPLSMKLSGVSFDSGAEDLPLGDAVVSPSLVKFLTGGKGAATRIEGQWGAGWVRMALAKEKWAIDLGSVEADLAGLPLPERVQYRFKGEARAAGSLREGGGPSGKALSGQGELRGEGIEIAGGLLETLGLSPLKFSTLSLFVTVEDSVLNVGENLLEGDFTAKARGTVRLVPDRLDDSRLDLTVEVKPDSSIREKVMPLFGLAGARPRADGSVTFRIRGTIGRPSITG